MRGRCRRGRRNRRCGPGRGRQPGRRRRRSGAACRAGLRRLSWRHRRPGLSPCAARRQTGGNRSRGSEACQVREVVAHSAAASNPSRCRFSAPTGILAWSDARNHRPGTAVRKRRVRRRRLRARPALSGRPPRHGRGPLAARPRGTGACRLRPAPSDARHDRRLHRAGRRRRGGPRARGRSPAGGQRVRRDGVGAAERAARGRAPALAAPPSTRPSTTMARCAPSSSATGPAQLSWWRARPRPTTLPRARAAR